MKIKLPLIISLLTIILSADVSFSFYNNQEASVVIGQPDFSQTGSHPPSANTLAWPKDVHYDGTYLYIVDRDNNRVLVFDSIPLTPNTSAVAVIGQYDFFQNNPNQGLGLTNPSSYTLNSPQGIVGDGNTLLVADTVNNRVLIYQIITSKVDDFITSGTSIYADVVIGQTCFSSSTKDQGGSVGPNTLDQPRGLSIAGNKLFIGDRGNSRILIFNSIPTQHNASANIVVGQEDEYKSASGLAGNRFQQPEEVYSDGSKLAVTDGSNNRILIWDIIPTTHNIGADYVVGQTNFYSKVINPPSSNTFNGPGGITSSSGRLFIADYSNNRILIFNNWPTQNNASADMVIGQSNFTSSSGGASETKIDGPFEIKIIENKLFVIDDTNRRVLIFENKFGVYAVSPDNSSNSGNVEVTITGDDLLNGSTSALKKSGESDIIGSNVVITTKTISCSFNITGVSPGLWDLVVTSGAISFTLSGGFEVKSFEVTKVIPEFGYKWTSTRVYIKGSSFLNGSTVKLTKSGETDINGTNVVISTSLIACTFNLWGTETGLWNIVITTGGITQTFSDSFLVTQLSPGYDTSPQASGAIDSAGGTIKVEIAESDIANMELVIPSGAISTNIAISITINISINPPALPNNIARVGRVIDLWPSYMEFSKEIEVKIPYKNSDIEKFGITDPNLLDVYTYDADTEKWVRIAKNSIDQSNRLISVKIAHFSLYTLGVTIVSDVKDSIIYPNPFKPAEHSKVTFSVPLESEVKIYNVAGELVNSLEDDNKTGKIFWTGVNSSGQRVASGIYLCVIKNGSSHSSKKLAIIR